MASWAFWTTVLQRSSEEYWRLTPREVHACCVAFYRNQDLTNARFGTLVAAIYNANRTSQKQKWLEWYDIFAPYSAESKPKKPQLADIRKQFIEARQARERKRS